MTSDKVYQVGLSYRELLQTYTALMGWVSQWQNRGESMEFTREIARKVWGIIDAAENDRYSVYPIVDGCSQPAVFEGAYAECCAWRDAHPEVDCILLEDHGTEV